MEKLQQISFPKREWLNIKKQLKKSRCSSVRCCKELGKYKTGNIYTTPWGDTIKIIKVTKYSKAEDIPTWNLMDKKMKISVKKGAQYGNNKWDYIIFKKIK